MTDSTESGRGYTGVLMRLMTSPASALVVLAVLLMHAMPASAAIEYWSYAGGCVNTNDCENVLLYCSTNYSAESSTSSTCCSDSTCPSSTPSPPPPGAIPGTCDNTCAYPYDGECDDGGPDAMYSDCAFGTDCEDCGVRAYASPSPSPPVNTSSSPVNQTCSEACESNSSTKPVMVDQKDASKGMTTAVERCKATCVEVSIVQDEGTPSAARAPLVPMGVYAVAALCIVAALLLQ
jgi:hypothetical protein